MSGHSGRYIRGGDEPTKRTIYKPPGFQHFGDHTVNMERARAHLAKRGIRLANESQPSRLFNVVKLLALVGTIFFAFVVLGSIK